MKPRVSVIIAVYNSERFINRCIDSIRKQTFEDWECLLIDDGSTDDSGRMCDAYALTDSRFRVFHKENGGVGSARKLGLENATGEYIIHVDTDDWVESNMLEDLLNAAGTSGADVVICDLFFDDDSGSRISVQQPSGLNANAALRDLYTGFGGPVNKFVRRECYKKYKVSFPENVRYAEDVIGFITLFSNPVSIAYLPKAYYHYDKSMNALSTNNLLTIEGYKRQEKGIEEIFRLTSPQNMSLAIAKRLKNLAYQALKVEVYDKQTFRDKFSLLKGECMSRRGGISLHQRLILWCSLHFSYPLAVLGAQYVQKHRRHK